MGNFAVLKKDLPNIAVLIIIVCLVSTFLSCGGAGESRAPLLRYEDFEKLLAEKETLPVEILRTDSDGNYLYKAPNGLISGRYLNKKKGSCLLLCKLNKEGQTYLQFIKVEIVASNDGYQTVKHINPDGVYLESPETLLRELARKNKLETRKRFLKLQRY
ncbi:MAG TPA: hypothetical protein VHO28_06745 [Ignavibacteriales bacterium]|nr:hypothetical protein [Ignavibacteriales bacterium]HEX3072607.1 hypothetical protein [Ignavibacteriales bacterium]